MIELSYEDCTLCPRKCHADRKHSPGFCGMPDRLRAARAALHFWEETCISGTEGSGAVFFSGCSLRCVFCQNREISSDCGGSEITVERLSEIFLELQGKGANNINLVTPTHFVPSIRSGLILAKEKGLRIPVVYNCGGYEAVETLRTLEGLVDVYLPDFKYVSTELAGRYSRAADYPERVWEAVGEMFRQAGEVSFDARGIIRRGVIVRHLVLPGHTREAEAVLHKLFETYGNKICYSIMNQYTPLSQVAVQAPELNRRLTKREYEKVVDYAVALGIENGYIQEGKTAAESFIPPFDRTGL